MHKAELLGDPIASLQVTYLDVKPSFPNYDIDLMDVVSVLSMIIFASLNFFMRSVNYCCATKLNESSCTLNFYINYMNIDMLLMYSQSGELIFI